MKNPRICHSTVLLVLAVGLLFTFNSFAASAAKPEASAPHSPKTGSDTKPAMKMVADFESDDLLNLLDGESGTWNLNTSDKNSFTQSEVVAMKDKNGKEGKSLKLTYSVDSQQPAQNGFWTQLNQFDARPYDHLEFDVKGDKNAGFTEVFRMEIKKPKPDNPSEKIKGGYEVRVSEEWQTVSIPMNRITGLIDFLDPKAWEDPTISRKDLDEFVIIFNSRHVSKKKGVIYLDNIRFSNNGHPGPTAVDTPPRRVKKTEHWMEGLEYANFLSARLAGFPKTSSVKKDFPKDDKAFLEMVAADTWGFFRDIVDQEHHLPLDTIQLGEKKALDEDTWIGDYTNVTNIGVYLMCVVAARDLNLITHEEAVERLQKAIASVEKLEYHESGFPYNYYDTTTFERTSYFVSLVDSGWLWMGLYVVKNAFPNELKEQAEKILNRGDFIFFYDPVERQMYHGYYDHLKVYSDYHYGTFYSEPRAVSYLAISRGDVPDEHWFEGLFRTFPEEFSWQQQKPIGRVEKTVGTHKYYGGYYEWKGISYVPSWGGSAFEALMPHLIINEQDLAPEGLGLNDKRHAEGQMRYALEELKMPVWGMSPSSVPEGGYSEFGVKPFGSKGYKSGVVTPHASVLALDFFPKEVVANMRKMIELYDIYGEYGFYDSVNVATGKVAKKYLALDQGMIFLSINNYLNNGSIRKYFHSDPEMKKREDLLTSEKLFEGATVTHAVSSAENEVNPAGSKSVPPAQSLKLR